MRRHLLLLLCTLLAASQLFAQRTVTGKVTDKSGSAVANASVTVKGTSVGTATDNEGNFRLAVPANGKILVISSVNFGSTEMKIGSEATIAVSLSPLEAVLNEVVVQVPYGTIKKTAFTGSEATISAKQITRQQVTSVTKAIEGLVPGVAATNGGGTPGGGASIRIRGIGSINSSSAPLYVLNGVPYDGSISSISTDEIESVTILKDATAASLYGSRAANGVIMITTKRGRKGRAAIAASIRQGWMSRGIPEYDRVGAKDYYEIMWEATRNSYVYGQGLSFDAAGIKASQELTGPNALVYNAYNVPGNLLVDSVTGKLNPNASLLWDESWEKALFKTAPRTNATVSISGANDKTDYYLSAGYLSEDGTLKYSGYKRYNVRLTVNTAATDWLSTGINIDAASSTSTGVISSGTATSNPFYYSRQMGPIYPVYQHNLTTGALVTDSLTGDPLLDFGVPGQMGTRPYAGNSNLVGSLTKDVRSTTSLNLNANPYAEVRFLKDFSFRTTLGINYNDGYGTTYQNSENGDAEAVKGRSTKTFQRQISLTGNEVLSWSKSFGRHSVSALAGHENYRFKYNYLTDTRTGFQFPGQTELANAAVNESTGGSNEDNERIESYFASANYDFDKKYLASVSFRTDGSSRFAPDVRWGKFYSFGAGWRISQENFMKNVNWINELKLKMSYGQQGNQDLLDENGNSIYYAYKSYYYADGVGGYTAQTISANPQLKWEGNRLFNIGFDFAFAKNRVQGSIEYFNRISSNLLFKVPLPISSLNGSSVYQNIGTMKNYGMEIQLGYNAVRAKNFDWRIDVNLTTYKNKITKLPKVFQEDGIITGTKKLLAGHSIFDFWLPEYAGVDAATGDALYNVDVIGADGKPTGAKAVTNTYSKATFGYHGSAIPKFSGGITNSFRYKNLDLSFLMTFAYGGLFYDGNYAGLMSRGDYGIALSTDILQRWQKPGDVTNVPRMQNSIAGQGGASTRWLIDGSYFNIKNITLSYTLDKSVANRLHVNNVQVFGNVDNLHLFTAKKGSDPQRAFSGTSDASYVPFRTFTLGLSLNL